MESGRAAFRMPGVPRLQVAPSDRDSYNDRPNRQDGHLRPIKRCVLSAMDCRAVNTDVSPHKGKRQQTSHKYEKQNGEHARSIPQAAASINGRRLPTAGDRTRTRFQDRCSDTSTNSVTLAFAKYRTAGRRATSGFGRFLPLR